MYIPIDERPGILNKYSKKKVSPFVIKSVGEEIIKNLHFGLIKETRDFWDKYFYPGNSYTNILVERINLFYRIHTDVNMTNGKNIRLLRSSIDQIINDEIEFVNYDLESISYFLRLKKIYGFENWWIKFEVDAYERLNTYKKFLMKNKKNQSKYLKRRIKIIFAVLDECK